MSSNRLLATLLFIVASAIGAILDSTPTQAAVITEDDFLD